MIRRTPFERLAAQRRVAMASVGDAKYWVAAERAAAFGQIFPSARFESSLAAIPLSGEKSRDDLLLEMTTGWMLHSGPVTVRELSGVIGIAASELDRAMLRLESGGAALRGQFTGALSEDTEWCDRRLLARIHRLTLGALRKQVESVNAAQFMRWLLRWQHVAPGSQAVGEHGVFEVMQQLQGFRSAGQLLGATHFGPPSRRVRFELARPAFLWPVPSAGEGCRRIRRRLAPPASRSWLRNGGGSPRQVSLQSHFSCAKRPIG